MGVINSFFYCLFMLTCTEISFDDISPEILKPADRICPIGCSCYSAPLDGIISEKVTESSSLFCEQGVWSLLMDWNGTLQRDRLYQRHVFNTLVLKNGNLQTVVNLFAPDRKFNLNVRSLILEKHNNGGNWPTVSNSAGGWLPLDIFHATSTKWLNYLSFYQVDFTERQNEIECADLGPQTFNSSSRLITDLTPDNQFDWRKLSNFTNLQVLNIKDCALYVLDSRFSSLLSMKAPNFNTIIIENSQLKLIERDAFKLQANTADLDKIQIQLRKLSLSNNQLLSINWLITATASSSRPFTKLWYLDLSDNRIRHLPDELYQSVPNLRALYLAGNRFKHFSYRSMMNWFDIDEFYLIKPQIEEAAKKQHTLYLTKDMHWINSINSMIEVKSSMLLHSLTKCANYWSANNRIEQYRVFERKSFFEYNPDQLQFEYNFFHKFNEIYPMGLKIVQIGSSNPARTNDRFGIPQTALGTRATNRNILWNELNDLRYNHFLYTTILRIKEQDRNAIRVTLFGELELKYFCKIGYRSAEQNRMFIDDVVDFLDEAYDRGVYVLAVLWSFGDNKLGPDYWDCNDGLDRQYQSNQFRDDFLKPLIASIANHSALVAIEVVDRFLSSDIINDTMDICDPKQTQNIVLIEWLRFVDYNARALRTVGYHGQIGIGLNANCRECFATVIYSKMECRKMFVDYTFVTIYSLFKHDTADEPNGYSQVAELMNEIGLSTKSVRAVYYVLGMVSEDEAQRLSSIHIPYLNEEIHKRLNQLTLGYFFEKA